MKKVIMAVVAAFALFSSVFAAEIKTDYSLSLPITFGKLSGNGHTTNTNFTAVGLDLGVNVFLKDFIGVGVKMDFAFPLTMKQDSNDKINFYHDYDGNKYTGFEFDALLGCALRPLNNEKMSLIITPGINANIKTVNDSVKNWGTTKYVYTSFGIGAETQFCYKFDDRTSFLAGCFAAYDFFGFYKRGIEKQNGIKVTGFILAPKIGMSYNL